MTGEAFFELLGGLDAGMVDAAAEKPRRIAAVLKLLAPLAAAACLVFAVLAGFSMRAKRADPMDVAGGSGGCGGWIDGIVVEAGDPIVVTPVEDSPFYGQAERFVLTMTEYRPNGDNLPGDLRVGEGVRVMCNTERLVRVDETTVEVPVVFAVYRHVGSLDLRADIDRSALAGEINALYGGELSREVTPEDVDFARAYKIYVGTDIFALPGSGLWEIRAALDYGDRVYLLPVPVGSKTVMVNLQLGLPLNPDAESTEEERQQILANEGHWFASAFSLYEAGQEPDYRAALEKALGETPPGTVLVGGLPFFRDTAAVAEWEDRTVLVPLSDSFDANPLRDLELAPGVYDYAGVKDYVNSLLKTGPALSGKGG